MCNKRLKKIERIILFKNNTHYCEGTVFPQAALATLGIPFLDVLRILVAILLLGNVEFVDGEGLELDVKGHNGRLLWQ